MMWWGHGAWGAGDWLAMSLTMVVFWGLLIALVVWLVRSYVDEQTRTSEPRTGTERADEVLAERFARGEIDEEEFTARRDTLHSTSGRS
jgi:putative membrane protein